LGKHSATIATAISGHHQLHKGLKWVGDVIPRYDKNGVTLSAPLPLSLSMWTKIEVMEITAIQSGIKPSCTYKAATIEVVQIYKYLHSTVPATKEKKSKCEL
jgi:hypothetical protein